MNVSNPQDYSKYRVTVDTDKDFTVMQELIKGLGMDKSWLDYVSFLDNNENIKAINAEYERNEGYSKSINND
jgi:spore coat polysaccharide biosynthesis protein SpsF (cytidylyltransferase family)